MPAERRILERVLTAALSGAGAHAATAKVFSGLDWKRAGIRPSSAPHSAFEILNHIRHTRGANLLSRDRAKTPAEMLQTIASHNSYHAAQVVVIRQWLGAWPPRSGGLTW